MSLKLTFMDFPFCLFKLNVGLLKGTFQSSHIYYDLLYILFLTSYVLLSLNVICIHLIFDLYDHVDFALKYFSSGLEIFTSYFSFPSISVRYLTSYFIIIIKNIDNLIFKQDLTLAFFCCLPLQTPNLSKNQKFYFQIVINFILQ